MRIAIICSSPDPASMTIRKALLELYPFRETEQEYEGSRVYELNQHVRLYTTETRSIHCEHLDKKIDADLFIFATKHEAKSGIPSLSVHTQGNWAGAELGGEPRKLSISPALYLKEGLKRLDEFGAGMKEKGFDVSEIPGISEHAQKQGVFDIIQECTHHGPFMEKPSMFIEIGSSPAQWNDSCPAEIIAKVIHHLATTEPPECRTAVGIGGPHHTPNFKKIILSTDVAIGHVCPKYMLANLDREMLNQAIEKTVPRPELIILDWKGLDSKEAIFEILKDIGLEIKRTRDF